MRIVEVHLENFKNFDDERFTFESGINAIYGPNGSGKTSILEAISWALFDYLPYRSQDSIVKLTSSEMITGAPATRTAKVEVTFVSDLDKKEYTVCRNSKRAYFIVDTLTAERLAETKREVLAFLKKHYNLSATANLEEIFINTIGVPQGTFTAIFLDTVANRQKVFDKVLNLEDYRKAFETLLPFKNYLKDQTSETRIKLASYSTNIGRIPDLEQELNTGSKEFNDFCLIIAKKQENIITLEKDVSTFDKLLKEIEQINTAIDKQQISLDNNNKNLENSKLQYNDCVIAKSRMDELKPLYDNYLVLKDKLKSLENKRILVEKFNTDLTKEEKQLQNVEFSIKSNQEKLEDVEKIKLQIKEFEPLANRQAELEKEKAQFEKLDKQFKEMEAVLKLSNKELNTLNEELDLVKKDLTRVEELKEKATKHTSLNEEYVKLNTSLNEIKLTLSEAREMAIQVKSGLCPFLNEDCKNISGGVDLKTFFDNKIGTLSKTLKDNTTKLEQIRLEIKDTEKDYQLYDKLKNRDSEKEKIKEKIKKLQEDINLTTQASESLREIPEKLSIVLQDIQNLGCPREKIDVLKQQVANEESLKRSIELAKKNKTTIESRITSLREQISSAGFDESVYEKARAELDKHEEPYRTFIKFEERAKQCEYFENQISSLEQSAIDIKFSLDNLQKTSQSLSKEYDVERHKAVKLQHGEEKMEIARFEEKTKILAEKINVLKVQLQELQEISQAAKTEEAKLEQIARVENFLDVSREIFRNCGPLIGKYYIENISDEANRLYQSITMQETQSLNWGIDYEITVEETGVSRSFTHLSGGEQMAAALSVRLALLKELSDINIAFFDEPTTNMDEVRRANLAEQIKNITIFDQLIIISHDDTFEKDIDHVIRLG